MSDEAALREKAATLTRMLNLQGTIGMFGHVSVRVPGTDECFISPGASTDKTVVRPEHIFGHNIAGTIIEHPGGCRTRPAGIAARRCAATAASWWARAPRRRFSPAR